MNMNTHMSQIIFLYSYLADIFMPNIDVFMFALYFKTEYHLYLHLVKP